MIGSRLLAVDDRRVSLLNLWSSILSSASCSLRSFNDSERSVRRVPMICLSPTCRVGSSFHYDIEGLIDSCRSGLRSSGCLHFVSVM